MKELYIHAGLHKTGTTYIQKALKITERELLKNGLLFPDFMRNSNGSHHKLSQQMRSEIENLIKLIQEAEENRILLSAEDFSIRFWNKKYIEYFKNKISSQKINVHIIFYFRRQDEHKESVYSEIVKTWYKGSIFNHKEYNFDFKKRRDFLSENFPEANIIVRPYHSSSWVNNNIFSDLITTIDPNFKNISIPNIVPQNVGHRRLSLFLSTIDPSLKNNYNVKFLNKLGIIKKDNMKFLTSPEWRKNFMQMFQKTNDEICKIYPDLEVIFENFRIDRNWNVPEPINDKEYLDGLKALEQNFHKPERKAKSI